MIDERPLKVIVDELRAELLVIERRSRALESLIALRRPSDHGPSPDVGEVFAQAKLAVRHVEDARMRLGKVLQYARDGVSVYDKPEVAR